MAGTTSIGTIDLGLKYYTSQLDDLENDMMLKDCQYEDFNPKLAEIASKINELSVKPYKPDKILKSAAQAKHELEQATELLHLRCLIFINHSLEKLYHSIADADEESLLKNFQSFQATFNKIQKLIGGMPRQDLSADNRLSLENSISHLTTCQEIRAERSNLFDINQQPLSQRSIISINGISYNIDPLDSALDGYLTLELFKTIFSYFVDECTDLDFLAHTLEHLNNSSFNLVKKQIQFMPLYLRKDIFSIMGKESLDPAKLKSAICSAYENLTLQKFAEEYNKNGLENARTIFSFHLKKARLNEINDQQSGISKLLKVNENSEYTRRDKLSHSATEMTGGIVFTIRQYFMSPRQNF